MKQRSKLGIIALCTVVFLSGVTFVGWSDHHQTEEVVKFIRELHLNMRSGQFKEMFSKVKVGSKGFMDDGGLIVEIPSQEIMNMVIKDMEEDYEKGVRIDLVPKHIQVTETGNGNVAVVTYYEEGQVIIPDSDTIKELNRVTAILEKTDDGWKYIHWHVSPVKSGDDDD